MEFIPFRPIAFTSLPIRFVSARTTYSVPPPVIKTTTNCSMAAPRPTIFIVGVCRRLPCTPNGLMVYVLLFVKHPSNPRLLHRRHKRSPCSSGPARLRSSLTSSAVKCSCRDWMIERVKQL